LNARNSERAGLLSLPEWKYDSWKDCFDNQFLCAEEQSYEALVAIGDLWLIVDFDGCQSNAALPFAKSFR
jgi:hypothetical protein